MNFVAGRNNLALTIYVPYDCPNDCPFCTSKKEYSFIKGNVERVLTQMTDVFKNHNFPIKDVVITGGEPTANIDILKQIFRNIPLQYHVYINTTLLDKNFEDFYEFVRNNRFNLCGVNVSRHATSYEEELMMLHGIANDDKIEELAKITSVRINCVAPTIDNYKNIVARWENRGVEVSFRADYTTIKTRLDLTTPYADFPLELAKNYNYVSSGGCNVCHTMIFTTENNMTIRYHRGKEKTMIVRHDEVEYNDIIIFQNGRLSLDWHKDDETMLYTTLAKRFYARPISVTKPPRSRTSSCGGSSCGGYSVRYSCGGGC